MWQLPKVLSHGVLGGRGSYPQWILNNKHLKTFLQPWELWLAWVSSELLV